MSIFKLPDLGEGLQDAEIVHWLVAVGDTVALDQPLLAVETAKAIVEVPSPFQGKIKQLHAKPGEVVNIGAALVEFELAEDPQEGIRDTGTVAGAVATGNTVVDEPIITRQVTREVQKNHQSIKTTPAVRALAQRLNVDLSLVTPTGPEGLLTIKDVELFFSASDSRPIVTDGEPLTGARRVMAQALSHAHAQVVPVTLSEDAILSSNRVYKDITVDIILSIVNACKAEPALNAWYHAEAGTRQLFTELNLGIAMDSPEGLRVPVIKKVNTLSPEEIRRELENYKKAVADKTILPAQMQGASFVLSNFGKFTGRYANPLVVPPSVAILGCGQLRKMPVVKGNTIEVGTVLPLSLTIDHRVITGGEAARFLRSLIQTLVADK
ncbi:MAG: Dihydrolipoyllysine-residue acetyltransferase component of pyruvate dehydrogenase complex [Pseudomonadota bacterium]|jgi:pyruvate dehydrogenase E2 component (dihydrolipoamide acetyltransferase)